MHLVRIDTHLHSRFSDCSSLSVDFLVEQGKKQRDKVMLCTDHGSFRAMTLLMKELPDSLVIPALEVEAEEGDFLVYSTNLDYIFSLEPFDGSVMKLRRDETTAVVWAHPCVSQRVDLSKTNGATNGERGGLDDAQITAILENIDGLELFNGTMLSLAACGLVKPTYFSNLQYLARRHNLACTGGSDAHEEESWSKVWTEFLDPVETVSDFVRAIKERRVTPAFDQGYFHADIHLNP